MKTDKDVQIFCENIRKIRLEYGLSKKEMAKILEIGIKSLNSLENGKIPPRLNCLIFYKIQENFGIRPGDLFDEDLMKKFLKFFQKR
ncbi:MAG: helix-turn-helix transcriptional regulator [Clostridia bacterium]|nr:helix-turn-helix transcriptional regulator [Clostridia bacterium]